LTQSDKVSTCAQTETNCATEKTSPEDHPTPAGTTACGHWNATKWTVTTEYNSWGNLECYWFLI